MRPTTRLVATLAASLLCIPAIFAQTNPPAADPHEFVTHDPRVLTSTRDRAAAIDLLMRARQKINLRELTVPYELNVSFETNGSTMFEGTGTMQEMAQGTSVRLTAQLQDWKATRILYDGRNYSSNTTDPVPAACSDGSRRRACAHSRKAGTEYDSAGHCEARRQNRLLRPGKRLGRPDSAAARLDRIRILRGHCYGSSANVV